MLYRLLRRTKRGLKQSDHLFSLPQEIQDMIFNFAFPPVEGTAWRTPSQWQMIEKEKRCMRITGPSYKPRPYPGPKVNEFLVSKRFFFAAAQAWARNQNFSYCRHYELWDSAFVYPGGIVPAFITKLEVYVEPLGVALSELPHLRELTLLISPGDLTRKSDKVAWLDIMDADDFHKILKDLDIQPTRLRKLEIVGVPIEPGIETEAEHAIWTGNLKAFEAFLRPLMMETSETKRDGRWNYSLMNAILPLYPGSLVCKGTSQQQIMEGFFILMVTLVVLLVITARIVLLGLLVGVAF